MGFGSNCTTFLYMTFTNIWRCLLDLFIMLKKNFMVRAINFKFQIMNFALNRQDFIFSSLPISIIWKCFQDIFMLPEMNFEAPAHHLFEILTFLFLLKILGFGNEKYNFKFVETKIYFASIQFFFKINMRVTSRLNFRL